jgi:CRP-like cAMP-binding protein
MHISGNLLLDSLSSPLRETILSAATPVELHPKTTLVRPGIAPVRLVFMTSGMASLVVMMSNGGTCEVGTLGRESVTGSSSLINPEVNHPHCIVQIPGKGLQVPRQILQDLFSSSVEFHSKILEATQRQIQISAQLSACNRCHEATERFARWLLNASDLTGSSNLVMTQESMAEMLGTRRTTVSVVVQPLIKRGLISVTRGYIRIHDRAGLMDAACECYEFCRRSMPHLSPATYPVKASGPANEISRAA